ncbi:MAG: pentapeptide repeat-containing protein [Candidatus Pacebacteria bacterium]|nr:pentapeptide repeat-containing protein [Candidatus Paceibacterota bacterium]
MNLQQKKTIINYTKQIIYRTKKILKKLSKFIIWIIWDFSGIRFVWQKIRPPIDKATNKRQPATFLLWIVSIYLVLFGITSQIYENRVDIIENRTGAILVQLFAPVDTFQFKNALSRISTVKNMSCPVKPNIFKPQSIFNSLFKNGRHEETVALLEEATMNFKGNFNNVNLSGADFRNVYLENADFQDSNLEYADFQDANLKHADFRNANLSSANFQDTDDTDDNNLQYAIFQGANLSNANFQDADLFDADFQNAFCKNTNFKIEQLSKVKTLYNTELDPELMKQMKKKYPHLFEKPTEINSNKVSEKTKL